MPTSLSERETFLFKSAPLGKAIATLAVPTIISQIIAMVYNLADTWYIGQLGDNSQVAAVTIAYPLFWGLTAIANLFGIGGGSLISAALGREDYRLVKKLSSFCLWTTVGTTSALSLGVFTGGAPFMMLLGADAETLPYVRDYLFWVLVIGGVPTVLNMFLAHLVRSVGASKQAALGMSLGGVLNILLDPPFIFSWGLGMHIAGAALATCISNIAATLYFLAFFWKIRQKTVLSLSPWNFWCGRKTVAQVFSVGLPSALQVFLAVFSTAVLNNLMSAYTSIAVAALGIVKKVDMVPASIVQGLSNGVLPLLAYNYGSGDQKRMKLALRYSLIVSIIFTGSCVACLEIFAPRFIQFFIDKPETISRGAFFMRLHCMAMPFLSLTLLFTALFQGTAQGGKALIVSLFRKGIVDVPLMVLMNRLVPMTGLMMVQPILDFLCAGLAFVLYRHGGGKK
ncbi:MAG: MATE family efflux transporter [Synergistaceae bacterium]|nr:MATE family efflux transporter [Synergistaceae bacterium]